MGLVRIREIKKEEYKEFAKICVNGFEDISEKLPYRGAYMDEKLLEIDSGLGRQLFGVLDDGVPAGFMELGIDDEFNCHIFIMSIVKESRHQSFGTALIDFAVYKADVAAMEKVTIKIFPEHTILRDWLYKQGFSLGENGVMELIVKNAVHTCNCRHE